MGGRPFLLALELSSSCTGIGCQPLTIENDRLSPLSQTQATCPGSAFISTTGCALACTELLVRVLALRPIVLASTTALESDVSTADRRQITIPSTESEP